MKRATTDAVKAMDRFRDRGGSKLLVLWVRRGIARVLYERHGWCDSRSVASLSMLPRLGRCVRPALHKVHKHCRCCKTVVLVSAKTALRMARAEMKAVGR